VESGSRLPQSKDVPSLGGLLVVTIPNTVDGLDDTGLGGVGFYSFSELGNVLVEGSAGGVVVGAPALVEEGVSVEGSASVIVEEFEDGDVAEGEFDDEVVAVGPEFGGDDFEVVEEEAVVFGFFGLRFGGEGAAGDGSDAGHDFFDAEGFDDEVVGADFETDDFVNFFGFGTDEEDGYLGIAFADFAADVVAVGLGHHDVEADEFRAFGLVKFEGGISIASG